MKKGITPIVSVILLVLLVVAVSGSAYYWITNVQSGLQESVGSSVESSSDLASTSFSIVSLSCDSSNEQIDMYIINTGSQSIDTTSTVPIMSVLSITGSNLETDTSPTIVSPSDGIITAGSSGHIRSSLSYNVAADTSYTVRLNIGSSSMSSVCTAS